MTEKKMESTKVYWGYTGCRFSNGLGPIYNFIQELDTWDDEKVWKAAPCTGYWKRK